MSMETESSVRENTMSDSTTTVAGGDTQITLDTGFYQTMADNGVEIDTAGDAILADHDDAVILPVTSGEITDDSIAEWMGMAEVQHDGSGLTLSRDGATVELDNLSLNTGTGDIHGAAYINGVNSRTGMFEPDPVLFTLAETADLSAGMTTDSADEVLILDEAGILLTAEGARVINAALHLDDVLEESALVGTASVRVSTG